MGGALAALALLGVACAHLEPPREAAPAPAEETFSHALLDRVLARFVDDQGRVDYPALAADRGDLDAYASALGTWSPDSHPERFPDEAHRLAYWINAYNASVLRAVLEHWPLRSVRDVRPVWGLRIPPGAGFFLLRTQLGGRGVSLYALENRVIRKRFQEPRIHFALNCASGGCPRLPRHAFHGEHLDAELEAETRRFVAETRNVQIDPAAGRIRLSAIFDWFHVDFERAAPEGVRGRRAAFLAFLEPRLAPGPRADLARCGHCRVEFLSYDWSVNDRQLER